MALSLWADRSIREHSVDERMTAEDAVVKAMDIDSPDLFARLSDSEDIAQENRQLAVSGAACAASKYFHGDRWEKDVAAWCLDVFRRASIAVEPESSYRYRGSAFSMHPVVFAAWGYSWLLRRGYRVQECQTGILSLAVDAVEAVVASVVSAAKVYASKYPDFCWVLFDILVRQCVVNRDAVPNFHSLQWSEEEAERKVVLLDRAQRLMDSGEAATLPEIPMPWIKGDREEPSSETSGYLRNTSVFLWDLAEKAIVGMEVCHLISDLRRRGRLIDLLRQLTKYTIQEITPPFAKTRRDWDGNRPFEWIFAAFRWLGQVSAELSAEEVGSAIIDIVLKEDDETALFAMESFIPAYMTKALLPPATIHEESLSLWSRLADWVIARKQGTEARGYLSREYESCAVALLFCLSGGFGPVICGVEEGWKDLATFLPVIERAVARFGRSNALFPVIVVFFKKAGMDLLPDPGLPWIGEIVRSRRNDPDFWRMNGEDTVEILKLMMEKKKALLTVENKRTISELTDILADNGVRGAGILQQEMTRLE